MQILLSNWSGVSPCGCQRSSRARRGTSCWALKNPAPVSASWTDDTTASIISLVVSLVQEAETGAGLLILCCVNFSVSGAVSVGKYLLTMVFVICKINLIFVYGFWGFTHFISDAFSCGWSVSRCVLFAYKFPQFLAIILMVAWPYTCLDRYLSFSACGRRLGLSRKFYIRIDQLKNSSSESVYLVYRSACPLDKSKIR